MTVTVSVPDSESEVPLSMALPSNLASTFRLETLVLSSVQVAASVPPIESFPTSRVTVLPPKTLTSVRRTLTFGAVLSAASGNGSGSSWPHETAVPHAASRTLRARTAEINFNADA